MSGPSSGQFPEWLKVASGSERRNEKGERESEREKK